MDMKDVMNQVREDLRKQPGSHFSDGLPRTPLNAEPVVATFRAAL